jgi:thioredoxin reductase
MEVSMLDTMVIGGGPAGLNAALVLGRVRRQVMLADSGVYRNARSDAAHGFLTRDGADPAELRLIGRAELGAYPSVQIRDVGVDTAAPVDGGFELKLSDGSSAQARTLLLATGMADDLPPVAGLDQLWGRGLYHCPYCHGWEVRDKPVAVLGGDEFAARLALSLSRLGCDIVLCTDGRQAEIGEPTQHVLKANGVRICDDLVARVDGQPGLYVRLTMFPGWILERRALFVHPRLRQRSDLAERLGCAILPDGAVQIDELGHTSVEGVYAAGDMCRTPAMPAPAAQVVMAAGAGARAAVILDQELLAHDVVRAAQAAPPTVRSAA